MKKIISAILLSAFYVFAQSNSNSNENDEYYHAHKGFYFSVNTGIVLANLSQKTTSFPDKNVEKEKENYSGYLGYDEFRLGGSIANVASIYGALGWGYGSGRYEDEIERTGTQLHREGSFEEDGDDDFRFLLGIGGEFYPFQDKESPFYGLFLGICPGLIIDIVTITDHYYNSIYDNTITVSFANIFCRFEIGKEFWISRRWSLGFALNYTIGGLEEETGVEYLNEIEHESNSSYSIGLMIRITH